MNSVRTNQDTQHPRHLFSRRPTGLFALALLLLAGISTPFSRPQTVPIPKEQIDWTWSDHSETIDPQLPNILLLGDSITRAYFPQVAKRFAGKANVYLFATSCSSGDPRLTTQLHLYFQTAPSFRVIHFNNGMHGWDYSEPTFAAGLPGLVRELQKESPNSRLVWATITPVRKDNSLGATNARIDARNAAALALMDHDGIPIDDQHALMQAHQDLHLDDVHFNDKGSELQGDQAATTIEAALPASTIAKPLQAPTTIPIEAHIDRSIAAMTLDEKISLISGGSALGSTPLPRLGIPAFRMGDGPLGAHDPSPSTAFAAGIALAATWDRSLAERIGTQIGRDSRSRGAAFLLGPAMNIYRAPMNGRNHEYFGEDPFLAGQIAVHYVEGLQSQNVTATIKHFAGNNSEFARFDSDDIVSERALREIYLPAFEAAVREAHPGAIMDAYNRINGTFMTENAHLNIEIAKHQWHFDGLIMSDWIATHDAVASANGGLDLEMPAPLYFNPDTLLPAVKSGKVKESDIDDKVRRLLRVAARFGWITPAADGPGWVSHDPLDIDIPRYNQQGREVALQSALESATLLKNDGGLLPLNAATLKTIAVLGPDADPGYATGGGSAMVPPFFLTGPFKGISDYLGPTGNVTYAQGIDKLDVLAAQTGLTETPDSDKPGVLAETFSTPAFTSKPDSTRHETAINAGPYAQLPDTSSDDPNIGLAVDSTGDKKAMRSGLEDFIRSPAKYTRWTGYFHAKAAGDHIAFVEHAGKYRLLIDGKIWLDHADINAPIVSQARMNLSAGVHKVLLEDLGVPKFNNETLRLGIVKADAVVHPAAIELARRADVVILSVGYDIETESESADREFQLLPGQNDLIQQVAAVNPHTIVVLNAGGSVDTAPWLTHVPALLDIWYSGEEGGAALASLLFGDANPSGRLPISWERTLSDNPSLPFYYTAPGTNRITYGDDIFVGYRGYEHNHTQPLFPFGFGLSYTTFKYSNLEVHPDPASPSGNYTVSFDITNTGTRAGADVAQVYVSEDHPSVPRPPQELKAFARVDLNPSETRHVSVPLNARSFAWYDVPAKAWHADAGTFTIHVSRSSADPQLQGSVSLAQPILLPVE
jgi:beta-glucosidase